MSIDLLDQSIDDLHEYVINQCTQFLIQSKSYTDNIFNTQYTSTINYINDNFVLKDDVQDLINVAKNCYTLVGTQRWLFSDILFQTGDKQKYAKLSFDLNIIDELQKREIAISTSENIIFKFFVEYKDNGIVYKRPLPVFNKNDLLSEPFMFPEINKQKVSGYIKMMMLDGLVCQAVIYDDDAKMESSILMNGYITCDVYARDILSDL